MFAHGRSSMVSVPYLRWGRGGGGGLGLGLVEERDVWDGRWRVRGGEPTGTGGVEAGDSVRCVRAGGDRPGED